MTTRRFRHPGLSSRTLRRQMPPGLRTGGSVASGRLGRAKQGEDNEFEIHQFIVIMLALTLMTFGLP
jgi:hypothetical protein